MAILRGDLVGVSDYANAAAAFQFFARDGWHWPLGANPHFGGVNIFFSDGAPWYALAAKGLHGLGLPAPSLHDIVLINFLLFALFAARLAGSISETPLTRWLITGLLVFCLIMPVRLIGPQHVALSSHWVVLWAMTAVPLKSKRDGASAARRWEFLPALAFATWSHGYLGAMAASIILVFLLAQRRYAATLLVFAFPALLLWIIGAFAGFDTRLGSAKPFSLDILALAQSFGWGVFPPLFPLVEAQGDSFIFLGAGAWLALLCGSACYAASKDYRVRVWHHLRSRRLRLLLLAGMILYLFGLVFSLRVAGSVLLSLPVPDFLEPLYGRFRAAGRFGTPLAYSLILLAGLMVGSIKRPGALALLLATTVLAAQAADVVLAGRQGQKDAERTAIHIAREQVNALLANGGWSGKVYRDIESETDLEKQQILDFLLTEAGAKEFRLVHSARRNPDEVAARRGKQDAGPGDLFIYPASHPGSSCRSRTRWTEFELCLL